MKRFYYRGVVFSTMLTVFSALLLPAPALPQEKDDTGNAEPEDKSESLLAKQQAA